MPYEVITSERASSELLGIIEYLAEKFPDSVEKIHRGLVDWIECLTSDLHIGDILKRRGPGVVRVCLYRAYRI